jgi:hypothetical protein
MTTLMDFLRLACAVAIGCAVFAAESPAAELPSRHQPLLKKDCRLVLADEGLFDYARQMEVYFTVCVPDLNVRVYKPFMRGIADFKARMPRELALNTPDIVTTCFGFRDGRVCTYTEKTGKDYADALNAGVDSIRKAGALVVVGSSFAADTRYFNGLRETSGAPLKTPVADPPAVYNQTLSKLTAVGKGVAEQHGMPFVDVHATLCSVMEKAKAALGKDYDVCGTDPRYPTPGANGQLVIAYVFLTALGLTGDIGTITLDMQGAATATAGHRIITGDKGLVEIVSVRYPFCFSGEATSSAGTRSILPFLPFNQDLNRLMLTVNHLKSDRATVAWGAASKSFTRRELEAGINLAEAFAETTPFAAAFKTVELAVVAKQGTEKAIGDTVEFLEANSEEKDAVLVTDVCKKLLARREALREEIRALVVPVRHTISVTPE